MDSKLRRELFSKAMKINSIYTVGRAGITDVFINEVSKALKARELIKISIGKQCDISVEEAAEEISSRTFSEIVRTIGRKIILYKKCEDEKDNNEEQKSKI